MDIPLHRQGKVTDLVDSNYLNKQQFFNFWRKRGVRDEAKLMRLWEEELRWKTKGVREHDRGMGGGSSGGGGGGGFFNSAQTVTRYCPSGQDGGPGICVTAEAGVFQSSVSQQLADAYALQAATALAQDSSPGPCCNEGAYTTLSNGVWTTSTNNGQGGAAGGTASITWDDATSSGNMTAEIAQSGVGSTQSSFARAVIEICNPWPDYSVLVTVNWSVLGKINMAVNDALRVTVDNVGVGGEIISVSTPAIGNLDPNVYGSGGGGSAGTGITCQTDTTTTETSGTFTCVIPFGSSVKDITLQASAIKSLGTAAGTFSINADWTLTPLTPPSGFGPPVCDIISEDDRPANDDIANFQLISGASGSGITGTTVGATLETGEEDTIDGETETRSVWYKWVATGNGTLTINANSISGSHPAVALYTGPSSDVTLLTQIAGNSPFGNVDGFFPGSRITHAVTNGTTYYIQVATESGDAGAFDLDWNLV